LFSNHKPFFEYHLGKEITLSASEIENKVNEVIAQNPKMDENTFLADPNQRNKLGDPEINKNNLRSALYGISQEDIIEYNQNIEIYYKQYADYLQGEVDFNNNLQKLIQINIFLENRGTAPGNDIDIVLHFPREIIRNVSEELPPKPLALVPPPRPESIAAKMKYLGLAVDSSYLQYEVSKFQRNFEKRNVTLVNIKYLDSIDVDYHVGYIKHGLRLSLDPLFITFTSIESVNSFSFSYSILAGNVSSKITESLNIIINKEDSEDTNN